MKTKITLSTMKFYASHGCYTTERVVGGRFTVDLSYVYDAKKVIQSDNVEDAISYLDVYALVEQEMLKASHTVERVANRICTRLLGEYSSMESLEVSVTKVTPPLGGDIQGVSVTMGLTREEFKTL